MRQDMIDTHHGAEAWAERLAPILEQIFAEGVNKGIEA
jgi:predicted N-formylglutamate amidohydrolase